MSEKNKKKRLKRDIIIALAIAIGVFGGFKYFTSASNDISDGSKTEASEISGNYTEFLSEIEKDNVKSISIDYLKWTAELKDGKKITTQIPSWLSDPEIIKNAEKKNIPVTIKMPSLERETTIGDILSLVINILLISVVVFFLYRLASQMRFGTGKSKAENLEKITDTFDNIIGQDAAKEDLVDIVEYLKDPKSYVQMGARVPKGVILYGPHGTGKTMLARALAKEAGVNFFAFKASEYNSPIVGVAQQKIRSDFKTARNAKPCIIFIDEIDDVGGKRMDTSKSYGGSLQERNSTVNQLLNELDGFDKNDGVIIVGATNRIESLDAALIRPGRFDRKVKVDNPDMHGRYKLFEYYVKKVNVSGDINYNVLSKRTPGFSGADIENLCNEAAIDAIKRNQDHVYQINFDRALDKIMVGPERPKNALTQSDIDIVAKHEAGHVICAIMTEDATPVYKATIASRGAAGGFVLQIPTDDSKMISERRLKANLVVLMGGRAAESVLNGKDLITTGPQSDIEKATEIATAMITQWGMSPNKKISNIKMNAMGIYPDDVQRQIEVVLEEAYTRAIEICTRNENKIRKLATSLIEKETMSIEEILEAIKFDQDV